MFFLKSKRSSFEVIYNSTEIVSGVLRLERRNPYRNVNTLQVPSLPLCILTVACYEHVSSIIHPLFICFILAQT
jgi:hypothetical protein